MARPGWIVTRYPFLATHAGAARALWLAALLVLSGLTGVAQHAIVGPSAPAQEQAATATAAGAPGDPAAAAAAAQAGQAGDAAPAEPDADMDGMPDAWEDFFGLDKNNPMDATGDLDGDGLLNFQEFQTKGHPNGKSHRYFAEGATGFFRTSIGLFNPSETDAAAVQVSFVTEAGTTYTTRVALAPRHRATVSANNELGLLQTGVATHVESDIPIAADRFMRWGLTNYGSSLDSGVEAPSTTWYFAEGATGPFQLYYLLFNPGNSPATVQMTYLREGGSPVTKTVTVGPRRRESIFVNTQDLSLLVASVGAVVTSNVPIVAERAMYQSSLLELFGAGGASSGASALSNTWYFAEGATGPFFDEYILLANPSATTMANAAVTFRRDDGTSFVRTYTVPPQSRRTIWINHEAATVPALAALATGPVSAAIQSDLPIMAERSMWWSRASGWYEAHAAAGITTPGTAWMIAEAAFDGPTNDQTFVLVANTSASPGVVRVTAFRDDGTSDFEDYALAPFGRQTIEVGPTFGLADSRVSVTVESQGPTPIPTVVEYVRYSTTGFRLWNAGGAAAAIPLNIAPIDTAPEVVSTSPANGAIGVARNGNLTITFSEPVNVTPSAFTLECPSGTTIPFTNTTAGPSAIYVLDPDANLPISTSCVLTIHGSEVTDADGNDPPNEMAADVTVTFTTGGCGTLPITPDTLGPATTGQAYGPIDFTLGGGEPPVNWTVSSGALPAGLTLSAAGVLSGTPTASGTYNFDITATDADSCSSSVSLSLSVSCPTITIAPTSFAPATAGVAYGPVQFTQTGAASVTWSVSAGTLPAGLTLTPAGLLSGTPAAAGTYTFTVLATDPNGCSNSIQVTIVVSCPVITVTPASLGPATVGVAYAPVQFTQVGAPTAVNWSLTGGTLPAGMTLSPSGELSGTPTEPGTFTLTVTATDANGCSGSVTVTLEVTCPTITVSPNSLTNGTAGMAYGPVSFSQTGAPTAVTWSVSDGTLPAGLTLTTGGLLSGTPTVVGTFPFTVTATDANGCSGSQALTLQLDCPTITITPGTMAQGTVGTAYPTVTFNQTGGVGTITWAVTSGSLPTGLTFNPATRQITGTPTAAGSYTFTLTATDENGCTGTVTITVDVVCPTITFNPATLPDGQGGVPYSQTFTFTGGTAPFTSSLTGTLPTGLTYNAATHTLSGTPTQVGTFPLTVSATDQYGCAATTITPTLLIHPNAIDDSYPETIVGNIGVNSSVIAFNVMSNDVLGPGFTVTPIVNGLSAAGGTVNMASSGLFTYDPPVGYNGSDSFTYTVVNGPLSDSATVSFTVSGMLWFINNNAGACPGAPCDGRRSHPFQTLAAFQAVNGDGAAGHPNNNHPVFIYESATSYTGPVTLRANQRLIGQDASVSLETLTGLTLGASAGTLPAMNATPGQATVLSAGGANAQVVLLNSGNLVRGLSVATGAAGTTGVRGTSGGTFTMADASIAGSGPAIDLTGYSLNVSLTSVASSGGARGIGLTNTTGSFTVTGTGTPGSGGTINSSTDAGVVLSNVQNVTLNRMIIQNAANEGIRGTNVNGFAMTGTTVQNNGTDVTESNIEFAQLTGTATFNGIFSTGSSSRNLDVRNSGSAVLNMSVDNSDFTQTSSSTGEQGILVDQIDSAQATVSITNSRFTANRTSHVHMTVGNDANLNFTLTGNTMAGGNSNALAQNVIVHAAANYSGETRYNIASNTITGAVLSAIVVDLGSSVAGGVMQGQILGNLIGNAATTKSGSDQGHGIAIDAQAGGTHTTLVKNNVIRQTRDLGIRIGASSGGGVLNATVQGNDIQHVWTPQSGNMADNSAEAIFITTGAQVSDAHTVCLDIGGAGGNANIFQPGPNATIPGHAFRFRQRMLSTVRFPGYAGSATDPTQLANFIAGRNNLPPPGGAPPGTVTVEPTGGITGGAACSAPVLP